MGNATAFTTPPAALAAIVSRHAEVLARIAAGTPPTPPADTIRLLPAGPTPRVGFVSPVFLQGGAEEWHRLLLPRLDPERVRLTGLAIADPTHSAEEDLARLGDVPRGAGPAAVSKLILGSDTLIVWGPLDLRPYRIPPRVTVVAVSHGDAESEYTRAAVATLAPHAQRWVGVSPSAHLPPGEKAVIPNGCDLGRVTPSRTRAEVRGELDLDPADRVILYLGRLATEDKRADLIVRAAARLGPRDKLLFVGGGYQADAILGQCRREVPGRFRHVPWTDAVGDYLNAADAGLLLSRTDSFALALAEYLAAGLPTVSTPVGLAAMHPEWFRIVPADATPAEYAAAIAADLDDPARGARTAAGREGVRSTYSAEAFAARWNAYLGAIAPPPPPPPIPLDTITRANRCPSRECRSGCQATLCHAGRGYRYAGDALGTVTLADCAACPDLPPRVRR